MIKKTIKPFGANMKKRHRGIDITDIGPGRKKPKKSAPISFRGSVYQDKERIKRELKGEN